MKKNNWFWNILIVVTLIFCALAFVLHYKNWTKIEDGNFRVISGIYRQEIPLDSITGIKFVPRLPEMKRKNGFSWLAKEKGVFLDSISGAKAYVFVDNLEQQKIEVIHHDSLLLFINLTDSIATQELFSKLSAFQNSN